MSDDAICPGCGKVCKGKVGLGVHVLKCSKTTRCEGCNKIVAEDKMDDHGNECDKVHSGTCAICEAEKPLKWHIPRCTIDVVAWARKPSPSLEYDPQMACQRLEAVQARIAKADCYDYLYEARRAEMDAQYEAILRPEWSVLQIVANILGGMDIRSVIMRKTMEKGKYDCKLYVHDMKQVSPAAYSTISASLIVDEHGQLCMPSGYNNKGMVLKLSDPESLEPEQLVRFLGLCCGAQNNVGSYKIGSKIAVIGHKVEIVDAD